MSEHPLTQSLSRINQVEEYFKARLGVPDDGDWLEPTTLFAHSSGRLNEWRRETAKLLRTKSRNMIGSSILQCYHWPVIVAPIGCFLVDRRVPCLSPDNLQVRLGEEGEVEEVAFVTGRFMALPNDPAADHPDATVLHNVDTLRDYLRTSLETHLGWVIKQLGAEIGSKPHSLWLDVADRCAATLIWLMQEVDADVTVDEIEREIEALIRVPVSPLNHKKIGFFTLTYGEQTHTYVDRASCCYWYRYEEAEGDCCTTCPRRPKQERDQILLKYLAEGE
ncbi:MAG: hypothetical protein AAF702_06615 [Chloroflexota bacterium]